MTRELLQRRAKFLCILTIILLLTASWTRFGFAGANLDQGSNGTAAAPISPIDWINGNAGASKTHLIEGYSQAYRLDVTGLSAGQTYRVRLAYDIKQGGKHAFDYLTHFACLQPHNVLNVPFDHPAETIDPTKGLGAVGVEFDPPADLSIPAPSSAGSPVPNQPTLSFNDMSVCEKKITIYNGIINSITYVSQGNLASTGNSSAEIEIMFTVAAGRNRVLFAWGAHIASAIDWLGNSASEISGSPYHMHFNGLFDFNGNAISGNSSQDRSLSADAVINPCEVLNVQCEGQNLCGASTCNPLTAQCVNTYAPAGTQCGDPNTTGICQIGGVCTGDSLFCPAAVDAPDGTPCTDSNACTQNDTCQSGACVPGTPVVCTALDQCHDIGVCDPANGICSDPAKANGSTCNDGNACTQTDTCQEGVCTGNNPVVCTASDQCHDAGVCNPNTGICSNPTKTNGSACNDGNACTQTDTCQSGVCTGINPVICSAPDVCHVAGTCDPGTGACTNPSAPYGTICNSQAGATCVQSGGICDGIGYCMPIQYKPSTEICRQMAGVCDAPEYCTGSNPNCPADLVDTRPNVLCRPSAGTCDPEEFCDGNSPLCPVNVVFDPTRDESCELEFCRTAGFWSTHAGAEKKNGKSQNITLAVIDLANGIRDLPLKDLINLNGVYGKLNICGENIVNTQLNDAASALESMCVSPQGDPRLQLVRQLTAASLNCVLSGGNPECIGVDGPSHISIEDLFAACNTACADGGTVVTDGVNTISCIAAVDCWNNGGVFYEATGFCQTGTCSLDGVTPCNSKSNCPLYYGQEQSCVALAGTCHDQKLVKDGFFDFDPPGPAGSSDACNLAIGNRCTVIAPGEIECRDKWGNIIDSAP